MTTNERIVGVDVASKKLDISDSPGQLPATIAKTPKSIGQLIKRITGPGRLLWFARAAGGYEDIMVDLLYEAKVDVAVLCAWLRNEIQPVYIGNGVHGHGLGKAPYAFRFVLLPWGMLMNVGEQLVSSYLRFIRECEFTQLNLYKHICESVKERNDDNVSKRGQRALVVTRMHRPKGE